MKYYNKWICGAAPALLTHLSIGSVYAWSVLAKPIATELGVSLSTLSWTFSIAIFTIGFSAALAGKRIDKIGAAKTLRYSALFYGGGLMISAAAVAYKSVILLFIGYGLIGGLGAGLGYLAPIKTLMKWFSDRKGLATGIAVMGFGFASFLAAPIINILIERTGIVTMLIIMGACYSLLIFAASLLIKPRPDTESESSTDKNNSDIDLKTALRQKVFYSLWFIFFVNILAGVSLISNASSMLQDKFSDITTMAAATIVGIMAICNGAGRLLWSSLSDYTGRPLIYSAILFLQIFLFIALDYTTNSVVFQILLYLIISCYGAGFSCMPAYIADLFGFKHASSIFGAMLTAWGVAGGLGGWLISFIHDNTNSYGPTLYIMAGALTLATIVSIIPFIVLKKGKHE